MKGDGRPAVSSATSPATSAILQLIRLARVVNRDSPEGLLGIKLNELGVLAILRDYGEMQQSALAARLCSDANTCVLLLNELETIGYIVRRRDPSDRRRHIVEITADGRRALDEADAAQSTIEDQVLAGLSAGERATLRELLTRALEGAAAEPERAADDPA